MSSVINHYHYHYHYHYPTCLASCLAITCSIWKIAMLCRNHSKFPDVIFPSHWCISPHSMHLTCVATQACLLALVMRIFNHITFTSIACVIESRWNQDLLVYIFSFNNQIRSIHQLSGLHHFLQSSSKKQESRWLIYRAFMDWPIMMEYINGGVSWLQWPPATWPMGCISMKKAVPHLEAIVHVDRGGPCLVYRWMRPCSWMGMGYGAVGYMSPIIIESHMMTSHYFIVPIIDHPVFRRPVHSSRYYVVPFLSVPLFDRPVDFRYFTPILSFSHPCIHYICSPSLNPSYLYSPFLILTSP